MQKQIIFYGILTSVCHLIAMTMLWQYRSQVQDTVFILVLVVMAYSWYSNARHLYVQYQIRK